MVGILGFLLFITILLVLVLLPIFFANKFRKWLQKRGYGALGVILVLGVIGLFVQQIYTAVYPTDAFYRDEFEYYTSFVLPESSKIIAKNASYPGIHGDYTSVAIIELNIQDFQFLKSNFGSSKEFKEDITEQNIGSTFEYFEIANHIDESTIEIVYSNL